MMKNPIQQVILGVALSAIIFNVAEARIGGGGNHGSSFHSSSSRSNIAPHYSGSSYSNNNYRPAYTPPPSQPASNSGSGINWKHAAAAAAVGAGAGYMMGHANAAPTPGYQNNPQGYDQNGNYAQQPAPAQQQNSGFSWFWLIVLAGLGYFAYRFFTKSKRPQDMGFKPAVNPIKTVTGTATSQPAISASDVLADGTTQAQFLRTAKNTFLHVQTMNSLSQLDSLKKYLTPEMFVSISKDITAQSEAADFPTLNLSYLGSDQIGNDYVAGVRFSGLVSETVHSSPEPFAEVWSFTKSAATGGEWLVSGIEQD